VTKIPKTYLSVHEITGLQVSCEGLFESPLVLTIDSPHGALQITLFLRPLLTPDQIKKVAKALQTAMTTPEPPAAACPREAAAYKSQEEYWAALKRDLDARPIEARR